MLDLVWKQNIKPKDAIHVATALDVGCVALETFDDPLIGKSGLLGSPPLIIRRSDAARAGNADMSKTSRPKRDDPEQSRACIKKAREIEADEVRSGADELPGHLHHKPPEPRTSSKPKNVLFLCTGNSARSIMAEAILNRLGNGRFRAYSAGSQPKGQVHPQTLRLLSQLGHDTSQLRSKSWDEFARHQGLTFDSVITVCNNAAGEACPIIPGKPAKAHWDIPDPAAAQGVPDEVEAAFRRAYDMLTARIEAFAASE